jgi:uncharacterized protein YcbX
MPEAIPKLANIRLHPIKSLDPVEVPEARIAPSGGLVYDRAWALYSVDGKWVNGKRTPVIHLIRATYSPDVRSVTLSVPGDRRKIPTRTFAFPDAHEEASEWFSIFFEQQITVRYSENGFPDDSLAAGPTIVSTASLQAVSAWFSKERQVLSAARSERDQSAEHQLITAQRTDGGRSWDRQSSTLSTSGEGPDRRSSPNDQWPAPLSVDDLRLRFRATLEINGVPAFWEDQLFGPEECSSFRFTIGDVHFEGSNPCARCPVPPRDPRTGATLDGFQKRFAQLREATIPPWSPQSRFDHYYRLSTNTRVASSESGKLLRQGDPLVFR